jgi:hypothetical protein
VSAGGAPEADAPEFRRVATVASWILKYLCAFLLTRASTLPYAPRLKFINFEFDVAALKTGAAFRNRWRISRRGVSPGSGKARRIDAEGCRRVVPKRASLADSPANVGPNVPANLAGTFVFKKHRTRSVGEYECATKATLPIPAIAGAPLGAGRIPLLFMRRARQ